MNQRGFTVVELLLVIVAIGLLGFLVFSTYAGVQRNQRNNTRKKDIQTIYKQLEDYSVENSRYPTLTDLNNSVWRTANMKALDASTLRDPSSGAGQLVAKPTAKAYSYEVTAADGNACDNKIKVCAHYTLTATLEGTPVATFVKSSLN